MPGSMLLVVFYNKAHHQSQRFETNTPPNDTFVQHGEIITPLPVSLSVQNLSTKPNNENVSVQMSTMSHSIEFKNKSTLASSILGADNNLARSTASSRTSSFKSPPTALTPIGTKRTDTKSPIEQRVVTTGFSNSKTSDSQGTTTTLVGNKQNAHFSFTKHNINTTTATATTKTTSETSAPTTAIATITTKRVTTTTTTEAMTAESATRREGTSAATTSRHSSVNVGRKASKPTTNQNTTTTTATTPTATKLNTTTAATTSKLNTTTTTAAATTSKLNITTTTAATTTKLNTTTTAAATTTKSNTTIAAVATATTVNHSSLSVLTTQSKPTTKSTTNTTPKRTHFFVCPEPTNGGIGNVMFEFASAYAVAKDRNMTVIIPQNYKLIKIFSLKADVRSNANYNAICRAAKGRRAAHHIKYDGNLTHFEPNSDYRIGIYLQSYKYFDNIRQEIRNQFKFNNDTRSKATKFIQTAITKHKFKSRADVVLVGVHIRRGDFLKSKFGYAVATPEYLRKAMKYFTEMFINVFFIVCTNDLKWTKEHMPPAINVEYVTGNSAQLDMCILTECDHTVITVGTFGWWAAWLNNKGKTVYFKWPAIEGSKLRKQFSKDYSDYFPPGWIGL